MDSTPANAAIHLLGTFAVRIGATDAGPRGRKARAILGIVAASSSARVRRDELAALLWSDRGDEQARSSLRQALVEIKVSPLGREHVVAIGRDQVGFADGRVTSDIAAILDACDRHDLPSLARCLDAVDGAFMAGFDGLATGLDEWLHVERPRHHDRIAGAVLEQASMMVEAAPSADVTTILRALDRLDPYNEVVARLGMAADHAAGDGASLHRRYRVLCEDLKREFGAIPAAETRALFQRLTMEPSAVTQVPSQAAVGVDPGQSPRTPPVVLVNPIVASDSSAESAEIASAATDDIRVALARHADVRVIALDTLDVERIESVCASALSAYILSGRLRLSADGARVNLQLGSIDSSVVVWSEHLRFEHGTIDDAIDRIVMRAVGAIGPAIERDFATTTRLERVGRADPVALYAKARHLIRVVRTLPAVREGMDLLSQTLALDADHVGARLLLAQLYNTDLWQQVAGHNVAEYRDRALTLTQEAVAIEPGNMRLQVRLAWCYLRRREWDMAERRLRASIASLPYDADATNEIALAFGQLGEIDLAIELMQRAFALNPFPSADYHSDHAILLATRGEFLAAEEQFESVGEMRLQYLGARLANLSRLPAAAGRLATLRVSFLDRFAAAWQLDRPYDAADLSRWLTDTYVFRDPEHQRLWSEGFMAALA